MLQLGYNWAMRPLSLARLMLAALLLAGLSACRAAAPALSPTAALVLAPTLLPTLTATPSLTPAPTATPTAAPSPATPDPTAILFYEPAGCQSPPADYSRLTVNGFTLNARTYAMLQHAAVLYGGEIDVAGGAITQGSYSNNGPASFGTHLGGGALDISVIRRNAYGVLYLEIEPLIRALRTAGFAAWLRDWNALGLGSGIHIHAIAIGDAELSPAAQAQIDGPAGYLRGYDGLPVAADGTPRPDPHGGPLLCAWMLQAGYRDLRSPTPAPTAAPPWQERLRLAAQAYLAGSSAAADQVARRLAFIDGQSESAATMSGPLAAAILRDASLLPTQPGPLNDLKSFWLASPADNARPWNLFDPLDYTVFSFTIRLADFDFSAWPLQPADLVYAYPLNRGLGKLFVVTEVDAAGRAYTVTNQYQLDGGQLIERYLLYDPAEPGAGIIYNQWQDRNLGRTGDGGFEVLRRKDLAAGSLYHYAVRPGDTLPALAARYGIPLSALLLANPGIDPAHLQLAQPLLIPIPTYTP